MAETMIHVENLTKYFGAVVAVDNITFSVDKGQVVGFLGPNGAGKSTTMRMLTCFIPPTSGRAVVAGHDVMQDSLQVRRRVGYLPENVPLYPEMRVREYLKYRVKLKDVPRRERKKRIDYVMERCRIQDVSRKLIGALSKGYRQRVGLADAMVHDPDILILDEPTIGLDPIQIRGTRKLISELGQDHTILLSTHILPEVEMVCERVIIITEGRIVLTSTLADLQRDVVTTLEVRGPQAEVQHALRSLDGVRGVVVKSSADGVVSLEIRTEGDQDLREGIAAQVVENGWAVRQLDLRRVSLEDQFVAATIGAQRQEAAGAA